MSRTREQRFRINVGTDTGSIQNVIVYARYFWDINMDQVREAVIPLVKDKPTDLVIRGWSNNRENKQERRLRQAQFYKEHIIDKGLASYTYNEIPPSIREKVRVEFGYADSTVDMDIWNALGSAYNKYKEKI